MTRIAPIAWAWRRSVPVIIVALGPIIAAPAQTTSTWDGSNGNWTDTIRWSTPNYPNNGNGAASYNAVVNFGTVTLNQNITVTGFTMNGGTIVVPFSGGPYTLTATGSLNWGAGTFDVGQTLQSNGTANITANGVVPVLNGTLINAGTLTSQTINGSGVINNLAGATYTINGSSLNGTGTFNNFGRMFAITPGGTGFGNNSYWNFNNKAGGVVSVGNSSFNFVGAGTQDGSFVLTGNAGFGFYSGSTNTFSSTSSISGAGNVLFAGTATFAGSFTPSGQIDVMGLTNFTSAYAATGQLRVDSGGTLNLSLPTTFSNILIGGGTLGGAGAITFNGTAANMLFDSGTIGGTSATPIQNLGTMTFEVGSKTITNNFTNTNGAVINWTGGPIGLATGTTLTNAAGANFNATANADISGATTQSAGTFDNFGVFTRSTGTGTIHVFSTFNNHAGATVNVQAGTLSLAGGTMAGTYNVSSATTLNFGSAESLVGSATFGGPGTVAVTGSDTLVGNSTITISGTGGFTFSGIISGDAPGRSLTKAGIGTLTLSGPNAYTGGTILNGGTLRAANTSGSATGSGAVTVASSATLAGGNGGGSANPFNDSTQGFISGGVTVQSGGIVGPGNNGVGVLTANGGFDFQAGSIFAVDLATHILRSGPTPLDVNTNDRIHTALTLSFGSSLTLDIDGGGQTFPFVNTYDYFIALADGSVGALPTDVTFVPTNFASAVKPSDFALSRSADGHDLILSYTAVPEPGTLALLGATAAIAGWRFRRR